MRSVPTERDPDLPTMEELIDALEAPGLLRDQPAVQRLLEHQESRRATLDSRPKLTLIQGGASDA